MNWIKLIRISGLFLAVFLIIASSVGLALKGLNLGIDFSGGYIFEFSTSHSLETKTIEKIVAQHVKGKFKLSSAEENTYWIFRQVPEDSRLSAGESSGELVTLNSHSPNVNADSASLAMQKIVASLREQSITAKVLESDSIDSQLGKALIDQGGMALLTAVILVLIYLSFRFEWRFASGAIVALVHDLIVILGVFAWFQVEFNLTVLASMLAIIGYSLNDSIIVADRVREQMKIKPEQNLSDIIDYSVKATLTRTLITSGTTLATVGAVWLLAGLPLYGFSMALFAGIIVGTISSISIAATLPQYLGLKADYFQQKEAAAALIAETP